MLRDVLSRLPVIASISSIKIREGAIAIASSNSFRSYIETGHNRNVFFALSTHSAHDFRSADAHHRDAQFPADRTRQKRFAAAGRAVEEDSTGRNHADFVVDLGAAERIPDQFLDVLQNVVDSREIALGLRNNGVIEMEKGYESLVRTLPSLEAA